MSTGWSGWNQRWTDFPFPMSESGRLKKQSGVNVATLSSCGKDTAFVGIKWPVQWIYLSLFVNRGAICSWAQGLCFPERRAAGLRLPGCGLWIAGLRPVDRRTSICSWRVSSGCVWGRLSSAAATVFWASVHSSCYILFCIVGYWGIFCFFVSICLLISNENSLLVFGFSACFCLCLPAFFSALFQRRFRERKVVLPNRLSGRFFYFSLYAAAFLFAISVFE